MGIIVHQANDSSFYKELGNERWMSVPFMMVKPHWEEYRERQIAIAGAEDWRKWAGDDKEEYLIEGQEDGEEYKVRVYDIKVDEPIKDSVFTPDS